MPCLRPLLALMGLSCLTLLAAAADFPPVSELPSQPELPDPLVMLDGTKVTTKEQWFQERRPELKKLFQHYMYGYLPEPSPITVTNGRIKDDLFDGQATKKEFTLTFGPKGTPPLELLVVVPNKRTGPAPVFTALNFCGNHTALDDPTVTIAKSWMRGRCPGCEDNRATAAGRGGEAEKWNVEMIIDRGYAIAMYYYGDVDPDMREGDNFSDGVHPHFFNPGQTKPGKHDWGAIAAWAYGIHRVVDYCRMDADLDNDRIAVVGHSRLGKTALLAAALDERIALAIPHQAGCGGTAPSRGTVGESVERINTVFPHWFNDTFPEFNKQVDRLPFDQHCLVALCAPRPVLFSNAQEDQWANPNGQFDMLKAASPVYGFLGSDGLGSDDVPPMDKLLNSRLGYYIRPGKHSMTTRDWEIFLDFADRHLKGS